MKIIMVLISCFLSMFSISCLSVEKIDNNENSQRNIIDEFIPQDSYYLSDNNTYYTSTTFGMESYFSHLCDYSPHNSVGSCGYVSLIQALSFYDTFYNDNIIPNAYDKGPGSLSNEYLCQLISPGTKRQVYDSSLYGSYYNFCNSTSSDNLQSRFTVIMNEMNDTNNESYFGHSSISGDDYQDLMDEFYFEENSSISVSVSSYFYPDFPIFNDNSIALSKAISIINQGKPAVLHIKGTDANQNVHRHSVVAYDYDFSTGIVYANFGWSSSYTHYPVLSSAQVYNKIYAIYELDFSSNIHVHSNNYVINNTGHCGCNLNEKIVFEGSTSSMTNPPILHWLKDAYHSGEYFDFKLYDGTSSYVAINVTNITYNCLTFDSSFWYQICQTCHGYMCFKLTRHMYDGNTLSRITSISVPTS